MNEILFELEVYRDEDGEIRRAYQFPGKPGLSRTEKLEILDGVAKAVIRAACITGEFHKGIKET